MQSAIAPKEHFPRGDNFNKPLINPVHIYKLCDNIDNFELGIPTTGRTSYQ